MREKMRAAEKITALQWQSGVLKLLDQRLLPQQNVWIHCYYAEQVAQAIRQMSVRGAPVIGIAAAFGVVLSIKTQQNNSQWKTAVLADIEQLAASRPTAVNLFWALKQLQTVVEQTVDSKNALYRAEQVAQRILAADREANLTMAEYGIALIQRGCEAPQELLTHCNTGALATGGFGTALGVIRAAHLSGLVSLVHIDETRPWLQGSRLTAYELFEEGIPIRLNIDSAAAHLMREGGITWVVVGADRITANGDVANKIGTYQLAVLARYHDVKFMVVAPSSTIDMELAHGELIPIEEREASELVQIAGQTIAAQVPAFNPVFDVTPAHLIDAIVTEKGVVEQPSAEKMYQLMHSVSLH